MNLKTILEQTSKIEIPLYGETLNVTYRPNYITMRFLRESQDTHRNEYDKSLMYYQEMIADWDLLDGEGNKVPLTEQGLEQVPSSVLIAILDAIVNQEQLKKRT